MAQAPAISIHDFTPAHLDGAHALSLAEHWPHRREDWAMAAGLSQGVVALAEGRVVGTALATPFGRGGALNMIIVAAEARGRGLGRALMDQAMARATLEEWRLVATEDGLPLYRKMGFVETGRIVQQQGLAPPVADPGGVAWAGADVLATITAMDRAASGMDRAGLLARLVADGRVAVTGDAAAPTGFAVLRPFGRGEVMGPVVARDAATALRLLDFLLSQRTGAFLRVDTPAAAGLTEQLAARGLAIVGGGVAMSRGPRPAAGEFTTFALASQALG